MSKGEVNFNKCDEYYTPKEIIDIFGTFDYDPFTTKENAERLNIWNYDTIETDGFKRDWTPFNKIWINPPFSMKKAVIEKISQYKNKEIYLLLPIESLTNKYMYLIEPFDIYIPYGRIKFITENSVVAKSPAFGSVIIKTNGTGKWFRIKELEHEN